MYVVFVFSLCGGFLDGWPQAVELVSMRRSRPEVGIALWVADWTKSGRSCRVVIPLPASGEQRLSIVLPHAPHPRRVLSRFCRSARLWQFVLQLVRPGANLNPAVSDMKHPEVRDQAATDGGRKVRRQEVA